MKYDTRSHGQKLEDMFDDDTGGAHRDPDPDELYEEQDQAFRHFDQYVFARPGLSDRPWDGSRVNGGAAVDGELVGGTPSTYPAHRARKDPSPGCAGGEVEGTADPLLGALGLATSSKRPVQRGVGTPPEGEAGTAAGDPSGGLRLDCERFMWAA